jgi:hypothetical protein
MIIRCDNPHCMKEAVARAKFLDPRRGDGEKLAYTVRHFCSQECELAIVDELERTAQYARIVN